jgi:hypothetical protein
MLRCFIIECGCGTQHELKARTMVVARAEAKKDHGWKHTKGSGWVCPKCLENYEEEPESPKRPKRRKRPGR